jgi:hypothetical protein
VALRLACTWHVVTKAAGEPCAALTSAAAAAACAAQGCRVKFVNALLAALHFDVFMPGVEIVSNGEHVNELHILVEGRVKVSAGEGHLQAGRCCRTVPALDGGSGRPLPQG